MIFILSARFSSVHIQTMLCQDVVKAWFGSLAQNGKIFASDHSGGGRLEKLMRMRRVCDTNRWNVL